MRSSQVLLFGGLAGIAVAHKGCGGQEIMRRNPGGPVVTLESGRGGRRRDDSNPCNGYTYPPTQGLAAHYPTNWQIATVVQGDTAAQSLFSSIDGKVRNALPNIQPHMNFTGSFTGITYDAGSDPNCWWSYTQCTHPANSTGIQADISTLPEPGSYGLTYDDGPNCGNAPLYGWMKDNNVRSTLFYIGSNVMNWPLQAISGYQGGHEICIHTWSHNYMTSLTNEQVFAELYYTRQAIRDVVGVTPMCWRPPFGDVDNRVRMIANELGLRTILWSEDSSDWSLNSGDSAQATVDANYQGFISKMKSGQYSTFGPVVLSHELSDKTINEALKFLPSLKSTFTHLVPIGVAYNNSHPYNETNISYPSFAEYVVGKEDPTSSSATSSTSSSAAKSSASTAISTSPSATGAASTSSVSSPARSSGGTSPSTGKSNASANASPRASSGAAISIGRNDLGVCLVSLGFLFSLMV